MRILLNTIPRTASKWFHQNISEYYSIIENLSRKYKIEGWFENFDQISRLPHKIQTTEGYDTISPIFDDNCHELKHRLNLLLNSESKFIIKIHPVDLISLNAIDSLKESCDYYYTIRKRNTIEQCLSIVAASSSGIAFPSEAQRSKILELVDNPVNISFENFRGTMTWVKQKNEYLDSQDPTKHLYYEDLIQIKTADEFCSHLGLPYVNFEIKNNFGIEHGDDKQKMIKNYDDLRKYGKILYKYNLI